MILEYKIACDNCNCIIDGVKNTFIQVPVDGDPDYGINHYCNENCANKENCEKCGANEDNR